MRRLGQLPVSRPSEIRLIRPWHVGVLSRVPLNVFGANLFRPVVGAQSISHGRGPRHREGALILDGELELQIFAPMVRVPHPLSHVTLLCVPCMRYRPITCRASVCGVPYQSTIANGPTLIPTVSMTRTSPS